MNTALTWLALGVCAAVWLAGLHRLLSRHGLRYQPPGTPAEDQAALDAADHAPGPLDATYQHLEDLWNEDPR